MLHDSWTFEPTDKGTVKITLIKRSGKRLSMVMEPEHVGSFVAGIGAAFTDAHKKSGRPDLGDDKAYDGIIPPIVPSKVGLLNPERSVWAMFLRLGEAHIVADISHVDLEHLGHMLLAASAPDGAAN